VCEEITAAEQRITNATTASLSGLREEIKGRFDRVDQRSVRATRACKQHCGLIKYSINHSLTFVAL
jgi:hypothetical protein